MMNKSTVLLVEDDEFLRELYTDLLEEAGFVIQTASDGKTAYDKLITNTFDITLLDVNLPLMNGIEVVKKLHENNKKADIVFLTNMEDNELLEAAKKYGCEYFQKSALSPKEFIKRVNQHLDLNRV